MPKLTNDKKPVKRHVHSLLNLNLPFFLLSYYLSIIIPKGVSEKYLTSNMA